MRNCSICDTPLGAPIYVSDEHASLTTMLSVCEGNTEVSFCGACGHLQTREIVEVRQFYEQVYSILADTEEEDQLYKIVEGRKVFQTEHRLQTLLSKVPIPRDAKVLDLGCAKGLVLKTLHQSRPDVTPCFFEVSDRYVPYWKTVAQPEQWATGEIPASWNNQFDLVMSFFVLEHVDQPVAVIRRQSELLKPGGTLYFVVPDVFANTADFVVADHLHHYSENSLMCLLERCGLEVVDIDSAAHDCAYVVVGRKVEVPRRIRAPSQSVATLRRRALEMSQFWSQLSGRIRDFERTHAEGQKACIYGAGFYGNFVATCLENQNNITCFVDQNPFLHAKPMQGKPVIPPRELDPQITKMYVGLNPAKARSIIQEIEPWSSRQFDCFYI